MGDSVSKYAEQQTLDGGAEPIITGYHGAQSAMFSTDPDHRDADSPAWCPAQTRATDERNAR